MIRWIELALLDRNPEDRHIDFLSNDEEKEKRKKKHVERRGDCFEATELALRGAA